jgi:hypothetical protein
VYKVLCMTFQCLNELPQFNEEPTTGGSLVKLRHSLIREIP